MEAENKIKRLHIKHSKEQIIMLNFNFKSCDPESENSWSSIKNNKWEPETFKILDRYKNPDLVYIDIGSWIGPTVLYASERYKKVISLEVDPDPLLKLKENISINKISNVDVYEKALFDRTGKASFFSRSSSMSTFSTKNPKNQEEKIINVDTITFEDLLSKSRVTPSNIALIKIDIEGGEINVIPSMKNFLIDHGVPLYISLHPMFLDDEEFNYLKSELHSIYNNAEVVEGKHPEFICYN